MGDQRIPQKGGRGTAEDVATQRTQIWGGRGRALGVPAPWHLACHG